MPGRKTKNQDRFLDKYVPRMLADMRRIFNSSYEIDITNCHVEDEMYDCLREHAEFIIQRSTDLGRPLK
jgi:hypothetical protein